MAGGAGRRWIERGALMSGKHHSQSAPQGERQRQWNNKPFFGHLPNWVYNHPTYTGEAARRKDRLGPGEKWALHLIAGQCNKTVDQIGSRRGCWTNDRFVLTSGYSSRGLQAVIGKLRRLGLVVKVHQGGGQERPNELAIPGEEGALDAFDVGDDPRFQTARKTRGMGAADEEDTAHRSRRKTAQNSSAYRAGSDTKRCENGALLSVHPPLSSSISTSNGPRSPNGSARTSEDAAAVSSDECEERAGQDHRLAALEAVGLGTAKYLLEEEFPQATVRDIQEAMSDVGTNAGIGARVGHFRENIRHVMAARGKRERKEAQAAEQRKAWEQVARQRLATLADEHAPLSVATDMPERGDLGLLASGAASAFLREPDRQLFRRLADEPPDSPLLRESVQNPAVRALTARVTQAQQEARGRRRQQERAVREAQEATREADRTRRSWFAELSDDELAALVEQRAAEIDRPEALRNAFARNPRGSIVEAELRGYAPSAAPPATAVPNSPPDLDAASGEGSPEDSPAHRATTRSTEHAPSEQRERVSEDTVGPKDSKSACSTHNEPVEADEVTT